MEEKPRTLQRMHTATDSKKLLVEGAEIKRSSPITIQEPPKLPPRSPLPSPKRSPIPSPYGSPSMLPPRSPKLSPYDGSPLPSPRSPLPSPKRKVSVQKYVEDETPLMVHVKLAERYIGPPEFQCYPMMSNPKGHALIINMINYPEEKHFRKGADVDGSNLQILWKQMGFETHYHTDLRREDAKKIIKEFADLPDHADCDCLVVIVMGHGKENKLICSDEKDLKHDWIFGEFINEKSRKHLHNKPKIFFVQSCRGTTSDPGCDMEVPYRKYSVDASSMGEMASEITIVKNPKWTDMLIAYSAVEGNESIRDEYRGTWFVETICEVFMYHAYHMHLEGMLKLVMKKMKQLEDFRGCKQMCTYVNIGLVENVYFNPGLHAGMKKIRSSQNLEIIP